MQILIKPLVTEKLNEQSEKLNSFGFVVNKNANKLQIKKAVEEMYNVTVERVNTTNYAGKVKTRYTKSGVQVGKTASYKKAIVTLAEGDKIDFYSNI
ncbi:50S ribosomal protein L23 [Plebeiibacterium marinum]|uniref:Large ribosomal subunit protein uL23 n=1 Tax=Plebeiibacterium marinum TaxID=2992111 RepID=A0AAE3MAW2_9BACT|nr:50S ribosomal protein L23 [Plebeiobacterium marinum]MCW3804315.1 50S ribosomal protein L23 [Plebeiobacterium marinum]